MISLPSSSAPIPRCAAVWDTRTSPKSFGCGDRRCPQAGGGRWQTRFRRTLPVAALPRATAGGLARLGNRGHPTTPTSGCDPDGHAPEMLGAFVVRDFVPCLQAACTSSPQATRTGREFHAEGRAQRSCHCLSSFRITVASRRTALSGLEHWTSNEYRFAVSSFQESNRPLRSNPPSADEPIPSV